jgi:CBS domain-containing protein
VGRIRDLMTVLPRTVKLGDSIVDAAKAMRGEDSGIVPIVDGTRLVGVLTDRDIVTRVIAAEKDPRAVKVEDIASEKLVTIDPDQDLDEALRLMARHQVRRLPVVEEDGTLIGIVARGDVARLASTGAAAELISE